MALPLPLPCGFFYRYFIDCAHILYMFRALLIHDILNLLKIIHINYPFFTSIKCYLPFFGLRLFLVLYYCHYCLLITQFCWIFVSILCSTLNPIEFSRRTKKKVLKSTEYKRMRKCVLIESDSATRFTDSNRQFCYYYPHQVNKSQ